MDEVDVVDEVDEQAIGIHFVPNVRFVHSPGISAIGAMPALSRAFSFIHMLRIIFIAAGSLSVALGVAGVLLPMIPATPFLLLATFFYARSSPRFLRWLLENRWLGPYIRNFRERRPLTPWQLTSTLVSIWISFAITIAIIDLLIVRLLLLTIPIGVTIYLLGRNRRRLATSRQA